ncbi:MAG: tRNA 2-thiouridine(34) synthase MnmA [Gammaproteobacteria bacterium]|nr:tRNA 2-thiouridine(34) synthase MnmA [Gammaproteobacteria bacterium]MYB39795.1 tRNA 2-thiouridine(34) synthase MnmA [Candidatus Saccharibacteria bacterium]
MKPAAGQTVFVGLSGGVDSSTAAQLLLEAGYRVVGVYMKNWSVDIGGYRCPWRDDYLAAKRLAAFLKIEFRSFDFEEQYRRLVVDYMIEEYKRGRTPNPDIRCNQEIKFKLFLKACSDQGADLIATGHYARAAAGRLLRATDSLKDQTYFLYRIDLGALGRLIFPLGGLRKSEVRQLASSAGLPNAERPESMGICFVGAVGLVDFLRQYVTAEPGGIVDAGSGETVGHHQGAIFYTIGQRHGLNVGGGPPYYVVGKDMGRNEVYVSRNLRHPGLWSEKLELAETHWLAEPEPDRPYQIRVRHGADLVAGTVADLDAGSQTAAIELAEEVRGAAPGQSAVVYDGETVVGGGILA